MAEDIEGVTFYIPTYSNIYLKHCLPQYGVAFTVSSYDYDSEQRMSLKDLFIMPVRLTASPLHQSH